MLRRLAAAPIAAAQWRQCSAAAAAAPSAPAAQPGTEPKARRPMYKMMRAKQAPKPGAANVAAAVKAAVPPNVGASCNEEGPAPERKLSPLQRRQLAMRHKAAFKLTTNAVYRIKMLLDTHNDKRDDAADKATHAVGIRIGVKRRGCSGYSYTVNYAFEVDPRSRPGDIHVESQGVHVYVEEAALFYVIGTEMDFKTSEVEAKFVFKNPNEKDACGCGESFMPFDA